MTQPGSPPKAPPSPSADGNSVDPRIGETFGKYKIIRLLGRGGMGAVYEGEDAALRRKVAVKFLPDELVNKPEVIERFMREAQVAGGLNHPNIIAVYDAGKDDEGNPYFVMKCLSAQKNAAVSRRFQGGHMAPSGDLNHARRAPTSSPGITLGSGRSPGGPRWET